MCSSDLDDPLVSKTSRVLPAESLISLFAHFESQFTNRRKLDRRPQWPALGVQESCSPEPYKTATEAQIVFQRLLTGLLRRGEHIATHVDVAPAAPSPDFLCRFRAEFHVWRTKFEEFLASRYSKPSDHEAVSYLQLHWLGVQVCFKLDFSEGALAWDKHLSQFRRIAKHARKIFEEIMAKGDRVGAGYIGFSYSMSICEILYFAGINCRDGEVRRNVIHLLRGWPRRDGVWDTDFIANMIQARMDVEENATRRDDVPRVDNCTCIDGTFICIDHREIGRASCRERV